MYKHFWNSNKGCYWSPEIFFLCVFPSTSQQNTLRRPTCSSSVGFLPPHVYVPRREYPNVTLTDHGTLAASTKAPLCNQYEGCSVSFTWQWWHKTEMGMSWHPKLIMDWRAASDWFPCERNSELVICAVEAFSHVHVRFLNVVHRRS